MDKANTFFQNIVHENQCLFKYSKEKVFSDTQTFVCAHKKFKQQPIKHSILSYNAVAFWVDAAYFAVKRPNFA